MSGNGNGNGNGNGKEDLRKKELLRYVGKVLLSRDPEKNGLSKHIAQCYYPECTTFWFVGGEYQTSQLLPADFMEILRRAVVILNQVIPVTPDEILSVKGLDDISHGPCRLCLREKMLEAYRRKQRESGYPDCFGTAGHFCSREECAEDSRWNCSHPCTIHPVREKIRWERMNRIIEFNQRGTKN